MNVKNVIIVNDSASITGGAGKVAINSAIELSKKGYTVIFFAAIGPVDQRLFDNGVKVICLFQKDILSDSNRIRAIIQGLWNRKAQKVFRNLISEYSCKNTIIHLHAWIKAISPSILSVLKSSKFEIVLSLHDYFTFCPNGGLYNYKKKKICSFVPSSFKCYLTNCDSRSYIQKWWRNIRQIIQLKVLPQMHIIALGELNKKVSFESLDSFAKNWYVLQNPIDLNLTDSVDISLNDKYLFVARLSSEKGVDLFCGSISDLGLKGIVLGDGPLRKELIKKYSQIEFPGWVEGNKKEFYIRQAKALVFPSLWYEGSPLTTLEMKSYGLPCIVSDKCAASEQIEDGVDGFVFKMGDIESLKNVILRFESIDKSTIQENVLRKFDIDKYSMKTHIDSLVKIYNEILKHNE